MHLICVQLRGSVGREPRPSKQVSTTPKDVMHSYIQMEGGAYSITPPHVLSRCVVIPKQFPTLLAEREIIANASLVRISPRTGYKITHFISISTFQTEKSEKKFGILLL